MAGGSNPQNVTQPQTSMQMPLRSNAFAGSGSQMEQLAQAMGAATVPQTPPMAAMFGGLGASPGATMMPGPNMPMPTQSQMSTQGYLPSQGQMQGQTQGQMQGQVQGGQPSVFQQAAGAYNTALQGPNIGQFMNPYTQEVIDRTAADINAAQQMSMNQLGAQAAQARAFGGSRHGVAEAQTNAGFTKQLADTSANLRQQGFNTALGAAQQQQQMLSNLAQQGFDFGRNLNQQRMEQGNVQRTTMQDLINAARNQFSGFTGAPAQSLQLPLAAVGAASQGQQTQTQTRNPGLFDYLTLGATALAGLR